MDTSITTLIRNFFLCVSFCFIGNSCGQSDEPLIVYAGNGLEIAVDEAKTLFEQQEHVKISVIYAGSDTLLATLQKSHKGDVFLPGSASYIKQAGDLIKADYHVALHVPAFAVSTDSPLNLHSYTDLLRPGIRIAVGNPNMCAIGRISENILSSTTATESYQHNIVITASTVNELLQLLLDGEVDAALVWRDMLRWEQAKTLTVIAIPEAISQPKEIRVGVLTTASQPMLASRFAEFLADKGKDIFLKHGFGNE